MTDFDSVDVKCPFYKYEVNSRIACEGIRGECELLSVSFGGRMKKKEYKKKYCESMDYGRCAVAELIEKQYE